MAGFVTPSVNISLFMKRPANFDIAINLDNQTSQDNFKLHEYYNSSTNSNSNDSYPFESDGYSSEASSSAFDTSFSNTSEMNSSRGKKGSVVTSKSRKTNQSASTSSQQKPKKSTGGGRKPNRNDKLTPEEEQKREKRRERNKLAAARCRKRRLDQTNTLSDEVAQEEEIHIELVNKLNDWLSKMKVLKNHIEAHENGFGCKSKGLSLPQDLFASLDLEAMEEAMRPLEEDDDLSDLSMAVSEPSKVVVKSESSHGSVSGATSVIVSGSNVPANLISFANAININNQSTSSASISPPLSAAEQPGTSQKRKRPNSLPVSNPFKAASVSESSGAFNSNALQTPSMIFGGDCFEGGTGLTPIEPTLTSSELAPFTPSTMAALFNSVTAPSPMEETSDQKKLIII
ncbi:PREDICTED: transcription factor kayak-like [Rhagoletis zephyria]|uniref:transcription factor kayak-like n=1 Tax=Rhagoletis zephyria TaxID=28612 RepID=UPI0008114652|nr:PREDICTED: transcription factor kayak-like [Rhagoletis zephyria]